jgi:alkylation response protein AidB-like acyl-CoA dehydrogenase
VDLNYSPEEQAFAVEVRDFLAAHLPRDISERVLARGELTRDDMVRWHAILNDRGWLAGPWPRAFGGQAWGPVEAHIFEEECCRAGAPRIVPFGVRMLGPVLMEFGTAEQQAEYLPRILDGRD